MMDWAEVGRLQRNFDSMEDPYYWEDEDEPLTEEEENDREQNPLPESV